MSAPAASACDRRRGRARAWMELLRVALLPSAVADGQAGLLAATLAHGRMPSAGQLAAAALGSALAFAFGLVWNDILDAEKDGRLFPKRPIPSGRVARSEARWVGTFLGAAALLAGATAGAAPPVATILVLAFLYDAGAKSIPLLGDIVMGLCRGGNFLLGAWIGIDALALSEPWLLGGAALLVLYVALITSVSRLEDAGPLPSPGPRRLRRLLRRAAPTLLVPPALALARPSDPLAWANAAALLAALLSPLLAASRSKTEGDEVSRRATAFVGSALGAIPLVDAGIVLAILPPSPERLVSLGVLYGLFAIATFARRAWVRRGGEPS